MAEGAVAEGARTVSQTNMLFLQRDSRSGPRRNSRKPVGLVWFGRLLDPQAQWPIKANFSCNREDIEQSAGRASTILCLPPI